jgi:hypothetical protein
MNRSGATAHAMERMSQRAIWDDDVKFITGNGTEVEGGYLVTARDVQAVERRLKRLIEQAHRLQGARVVIADGRSITVYHARRRKERQLLREAKQRSSAR